MGVCHPNDRIAGRAPASDWRRAVSSLGALLAFGALAGPALAETPSDSEQYLIELVNRARGAPEAEAARLSIDLNEGLGPGEISPDPKPPVAPEVRLTAAALGHSEWMLAEQSFDHIGEGGSDPGERMEAEGYPTWGWGEIIAWASAGSGSVAALDRAHDILFDSPFHRLVMLNDSYREAGFGAAFGPFQGYPAVLVTEKLSRRRVMASIITGVVYDDHDGDAFYSPGEGRGGVYVAAVNLVDSSVYETLTFPSGGYAIEVPDGTYAVGAPGMASQPVHENVAVSGRNVKVDFVPEPGALLQLAAGWAGLAGLGRRRAASTRRAPE